MTTIAWDGKTLAADKRGTDCGCPFTVTKIRRIGVLLVGGSGEPSLILAMFDWIEQGRDKEKFPAAQRTADDYQKVIVIEAGQPFIYERTPFAIPFEDKHMAIGSGRDFALAAMYLGCDAITAVKVASALNTGTGNGVDSLSFEEARSKA